MEPPSLIGIVKIRLRTGKFPPAQALVAWAAGDKLFPIEHGRRLAELLPRGRFTQIPDCRTFIPEEQPERLAALVRGFLSA